MSKEEFENLVNRYSGQVLNVAMRVLADVQLAQDVHQEVFLAIWRRWGRFDGQTNWSGYLYRTTVRKAIQAARQFRPVPVADQPDRLAVSNDQPDSALRAAELQQKLAAALARLPARQAEVFALARLEGLDHQRIGRMLGCSPQTVRVHLCRALKRLTSELSDYLQ